MGRCGCKWVCVWAKLRPRHPGSCAPRGPLDRGSGNAIRRRGESTFGRQNRRRMRLARGQSRLQTKAPSGVVKEGTSGAIWFLGHARKLGRRQLVPIGPNRSWRGVCRNHNSASPEGSGAWEPPHGPRFQGSAGLPSPRFHGPTVLQRPVIGCLAGLAAFVKQTAPGLFFFFCFCFLGNHTHDPGQL